MRIVLRGGAGPARNRPGASDSRGSVRRLGHVHDQGMHHQRGAISAAVPAIKRGTCAHTCFHSQGIFAQLLAMLTRPFAR